MPFKAAREAYPVTVVAVILALVAVAVLVRLWLRAPQNTADGRGATTLLTIAAALLVLALALLAATGRLHWLAAVGAALLPFLKRGLGLLRHLPLLGSLFGSLRGGTRGAGHGHGNRPGAGATMTRSQALEILGLGSQPTRDEVVSAHRHLMQKLHPDRGGTKFLAQQLNEAKALLLQDFER